MTWTFIVLVTMVYADITSDLRFAILGDFGLFTVDYIVSAVHICQTKIFCRRHTILLTLQSMNYISVNP